jgi:hypothetical protein
MSCSFSGDEPSRLHRVRVHTGLVKTQYSVEGSDRLPSPRSRFVAGMHSTSYASVLLCTYHIWCQRKKACRNRLQRAKRFR